MNNWLIINVILILFLSKKYKRYKLDNIPTKKPTQGSWIAYNQNQKPPNINQFKVSINAPKNKPIIGPKNQPIIIVGNHVNEMDIPIPGILIEIAFNAIANAIKNPRIHRITTERKVFIGLSGNKKIKK